MKIRELCKKISESSGTVELEKLLSLDRVLIVTSAGEFSFSNGMICVNGRMVDLNISSVKGVRILPCKCAQETQESCSGVLASETPKIPESGSGTDSGVLSSQVPKKVSKPKALFDVK